MCIQRSHNLFALLLGERLQENGCRRQQSNRSKAVYGPSIGQNVASTAYHPQQRLRSRAGDW